MALGYEGYIMVGDKYALGTGTSVPRARSRLDSLSGYGGQIKTPVAEIGLGAPRIYDWEVHDGSVNFELSRDFWDDPLQPWIVDVASGRQTANKIYFVSRDGNIQQYDNSFWNAISISAGEGAAAEGSVGFVAIERTTYAYGIQGTQGYIDNVEGQNVLCSAGSPAFPPALNKNQENRNPLPFWKTKFVMGAETVPFINWSLDFAQEVVKFFACTHAGGVDPGPKEPEYLAAGPMTVTFSGSHMLRQPLGNDIAAASLFLDDLEFKMQLLEAQTDSDDVQTGDALVPLTVEFAVYGIDQA